MKIKTFLIAAAVTGALAGGAVFGIRTYMRQSAKPVRVVSVDSVKMESWWFDSASTISGTVYSSDSQSIKLEGDQILKEVFVNEGDEVKRGDKILEYDMTMEELEREMADLTRQTYELTLQTQEKELEDLMKRPGAASIAAKLEEEEAKAKAKSADELIVDPAEVSDPVSAAEPAYDAASVQDAAVFDAAVGSAGDASTPGDTIIDDAGIDDTVIDDGSIPDPSQDGDGIEDEILDPDDIIDAGDEIVDDDLIDGVGDIEDDMVTDPAEDFFGDDEQTDPAADSESVQRTDEEEKMIRRLSEFLWLYSLLTSQYHDDPSSLNRENIRQALEIYETYLAQTPSADKGTVHTYKNGDAFGNIRQENIYMLSPEALALLASMDASDGDSVVADIDAAEADEDGLIDGGVADGDAQTGGDADSVIADDMFIDTDDTMADTAAEQDSGRSGGNVASVYEAYIAVCYYNLIAQMNAVDTLLSSAGVTVQTATSETAEAIRSQIIAAANAYYKYDSAWGLIRQVLSVSYGVRSDILDSIDNSYSARIKTYIGENMNIKDSSDGTLSWLIYLLNDRDTVQETETEPHPEQTEPFTEGDYGDFGFDDLDDEYDEDYLTPEELRESIYEAKLSISETRLQIRETDIKIRQYDRKLSQRVVKATMDGIVHLGGGNDYMTADDFVTITGEAGMYVTGALNELSRDTVKIGDKITGTSWENGEAFTATVTEISVYPQTDENYYWGYGSENSNASYYPFTAYIEDSSTMVEGSVEMQFETTQETGGIYVDNYLIRTDDNGRDYVYIRGEDGLLKKTYVKTGKSLWSSYTEILQGLSGSDYIAFPYGKGVTDGAKTVIADSLEEEY